VNTEGAIQNGKSRETGNIDEVVLGQTTQWPKEKGQKGEQRSTKHYTHKANDRVTIFTAGRV
jgi:hypothetical protein